MIHAECVDSRHPCFPCKMKIWRERGAPIARPSVDFMELPSVRERERQIIADAAAAGREIERA